MIDTASLSNLLNGKALKALSDGSVDFYAVAVSVWFGKQISLRPSLGSDAVHSHIAARGDVQSALAKSLSIGWGHSTVATELSRTEAGTNALLLIGALATGTSPASAAQCLSELLVRSGCDTDALPNADALRRMVTYLAPFVYDLGFSKVLEDINTAALRMIARQNGDAKTSRSHLESLGTAPAWADAIKKLLAANERDESVYLETRFRGSWLAAFASDILGMSTQVYLGDVEVWSSAGDRGRVVFQLATRPSASEPAVTIDSPPPARNDPKRIEVDYLLGDALETLLRQENDPSAEFLAMVQRSISREALVKLSKVTSGQGLVTRKTLDEVLKAIGVSEDVLQSIDASSIKPLAQADDSIGPYLRSTGLDHVQESEWAVLTNQCERHRGKSASEVIGCGSDTTRHCYCGRVGGIILGFACSALALMFCQFDASSIRMQGSVLSGSYVTSWARHVTRNDRVGDMKFYHILLHIIHLVSGGAWVDSTAEERSAGAEVVGLSTASHTVSYTGIMKEECFDDLGRFLSLQSGRASYNGVLRPTILQTENTCYYESPAQQSSGSGSTLNVRFTTSLGKNAIIVDTEVGSGSTYKKVVMEDGMHRLLFGGGASKAVQGSKLEQLLLGSAISSGN